VWHSRQPRPFGRKDRRGAQRPPFPVGPAQPARISRIVRSPSLTSVSLGRWIGSATPGGH